MLKHSFAAALVLVALVLSLPGTASADAYSCVGVASSTLCWQPPVSGVTGQRDLDDLDHHLAYSWKIDNITTTNLPTGATITGATLAFKNIRNWDASANRLFVHLLDASLTTTAAAGSPYPTGTKTGVSSFTDDASATPTVFDDNFANETGTGMTGLYDCSAGAAPDCNPLVAHPTEPGNTALGITSGTGTATVGYLRGVTGDATHSFGTTGEDYTFTFTAAQLTALASYIGAGGDFVLGIDPDCHYFNDGLTFQLTFSQAQTGVPEPSSILLLGTMLAGVYHVVRKRQAGQKA